MIWDFIERMSVSPLIYKCYITKDEETLLQKKGITIYYRRIKKHSLKCYTAAAGKAKGTIKKGKLLVLITLMHGKIQMPLFKEAAAFMIYLYR